jgi:hypothetical protein
VLQIEHWSGQGVVNVAESAGGVLATVDPLANVIRGDLPLWPAPELIQKLYASGRWKGKTPEDDRAARQCLGHYCDLQSLNSEDAITWSFFGPLVYGPTEWRLQFASALFQMIGIEAPRSVAVWLWRRIPHPEKPASTGGPEIDFGLQSEACVVFGEAKWNSILGVGQGVAKDKSQLDLRLAYCGAMGPRAIPNIRHWTVLGVGRSDDVLGTTTNATVPVHNTSWNHLIELMPSLLRAELAHYLAWKERYSTSRPTQRYAAE